MDLRVAQSDDIAEILPLLRAMHTEIGQFSMDEEKVATGIADVVAAGAAFVLVEEGEIVGSIGLAGAEPWYTRERLIIDRWIYIAPDHRSPHSFEMLVAAARAAGQALGKRVLLQLYTTRDTQRKELLFRRHGDQVLRVYQFEPVGGQFETEDGHGVL